MRFANVAGRLAVVDADRAVDAARASGGRFSANPQDAFADWDALLRWARGIDPGTGVTYDPDELGPPVVAPSQVFAVALNYAPHAAEAGYEPPATPLVFTKFPSCLTGPRGTVELPPGNVDWEVELVVVIARDAFRVPADRAWDVVAGVTVGQDLSERLLQTAGKPAQFSLGKSHRGFGPIGPVLVTVDELDDPDDLELSCRLGDWEVQRGRTRDMIFPVGRLIEFISAVCPLRGGDLIFTGTPEGVGNRRTPKRFLTPADELISTVDGVGTMRHRFTERPGTR